MTADQIHLLRTRRFLPLFATQFLGAFNDNLFKNALIILILYRLADKVAMEGGILVTLAAGIFLLPFFLFSALAGQLADKFEKSIQIQRIKIAEIIIMVLAVISFMLGAPYLLIGVLFLMGTQSAFFGPLKYAILPDHLQEDELIGGNAFVEAGTFLSILLGTIAGGLIILTSQGVLIICVSVVLVAALGYGASRAIPAAPPPAPELKINFNIAAQTWKVLRTTLRAGDLRLIVLGISWFWLLGATFLAQFPALVKNVLHADEQVVTLFLTAFSIGIGVGSLMCNRLLSGKISGRYVPYAMGAITIFTVDLYFAIHQMPQPASGLMNVGMFLSHFEGWRILLDLVAIAMSGGLFIVPLYALMQTRSPKGTRARTISGNNVLNALFMTLGTLAAAALMAAGLSVPGILLTIGLLNAGVALLLGGLRRLSAT